MKKVFINVNSLDGCSLHRLILPYLEMQKQTDEFQFTFGLKEGTTTFEECVEQIASHDILVFHRMLADGLLDAIKKKNPNIKVIIDMDDNWRLNKDHMLNEIYKLNNTSEKIEYHLRNADYVTCTTEYLANKIKPYNNNIFIFPNALNPEEQFTPEPTKSNRLRFGIIGSATHNKDLELLNDIMSYIPEDIRNKIQIVLCGFNVSYNYYKDKDGSLKQTQTPFNDNEWVKMEKRLTGNYKYLNQSHKEELKTNTPSTDISDCYRRIMSKDIYNYATCYNDIDVLLVPLLKNDFTACKSELKLIEASVMNKAAIVSDTIPYTICGINALEKGGIKNPNGNCLMISETKGVRGWAKAIIKLVKDPELLNMMVINLSKLTQPGSPYCLTDVCKKRIEMLRNI